ncbi:3'-5' exonuclease [Candidatus Halobeggiatoa sp. HSG11]|nr:3'-5' exonuclease [Candidatus Halobeggiatoa sp. HSG11]
METLKYWMTGIQTYIKYWQGVEKCFSNPNFKTLHDIFMQLDVKTLGTQMIDDTRFVVIDTETTGLHAYSGDEIISICMLEMEGLKLTGREYKTYVNPQRNISDESTAIHGIKNEDVVDSPKITEILPDIVEFIDKSVIVGHHLNFDIRFLNKTFQKSLLCKLPHLWIDTMMLYIAYSGRMGHYTLDEITQICKVENPARHTAYGDAMATALIFQRITSRMLASNKHVNDLVKTQFEVGHF